MQEQELRAHRRSRPAPGTGDAQKKTGEIFLLAKNSPLLPSAPERGEHISLPQNATESPHLALKLPANKLTGNEGGSGRER